MERFFTVGNESKLYKQFIDHNLDRDNAIKIVKGILDENEIFYEGINCSKSGICGYKMCKLDSLYVTLFSPQINEGFESQFGKSKIINGKKKIQLRTNSKLARKMKNRLIESEFRNISKVDLRDYFNCIFESGTYKLFMHSNILYGSVNFENLGKCECEHIKFIKGSEFYRVIEEIN